MRAKIALFTFLSMTVGLCSNVHAQGAVVKIKESKFNSATNYTDVTLQVTNTSSKDITAFVVTGTAFHADGQTMHSEYDADYLPALAALATKEQSSEVFGYGENMQFHPGATKEIQTGFSAWPGNPIANLEYKVAAVVYVDRTAQVYDEEAFGRILEHRAGYAQGARFTIDAIRKATLDPANEHPLRDVANALHERDDKQRKEHSKDMVAVHGLNSILPVVESIKPQMDSTKDARALTGLADRLEKEAPVYELHSQIERIK